jgi:hypothetical protein
MAAAKKLTNQSFIGAPAYMVAPDAAGIVVIWIATERARLNGWPQSEHVSASSSA